MDDWLSFSGTATKLSSTYKLTATSGNGSLELPINGVRVDGGKVQIKVGSVAQNIQHPTVIDASQKPTSADTRANCPGWPKTFCVGLVLFCCANHEALGPCFGAWDCS